MNSPTAQPARATICASHPYLLRPLPKRTALPAQPAANAAHATVTSSSTEYRTINTAATPYPATTSRPARADNPSRRHGLPVPRFIAAPDTHLPVSG
ncbi:Uncharacterised protein [Mycobacterium tuberculosis]|nr:Uncharacterised protein [Mycobacterium tuberculosis]